MTEPTPDQAAPKISAVAAAWTFGGGCLLAVAGVLIMLVGLAFTVAVSWDGQFHYGVLAFFVLIGISLIVLGYVMPTARGRSSASDPADRDGGRR